jgi:5'-methylthioadenosine phosphorylase
MTQHPEAVLARELGLCYATLALVTDYDTGVEGVEGAGTVSQAEVFAFFEANVHRLRGLLLDALPAIPAERSCACADGGNGVEPVPPDGGPG